MANAAIIENDSPSVLLIGGSGRSGTNLAKSLIGRHSRVFALPFEHRISIDPGGIVDFYGAYSSNWSPYMADARIRQLNDFLKLLGRQGRLDILFGAIVSLLNRAGVKVSPPAYHGWNLHEVFPDYFDLVEQLIDDLSVFSFAGRRPGSKGLAFNPRMNFEAPKGKDELAVIFGNFLNQLIANCLEKYEKDIFVEDNTWNILFARELMEMLPQAKLLHVFRNPWDVIASTVEQRWAPNDLLQAGEWYQQIMLHWFELRKDLPSEKLLEVRFEDLVEQPNRTMSQIFSFAQMDKEGIQFKVDKQAAHIGRWRKKFSDSDIEKIVDQIKPIEKELGYK